MNKDKIFASTLYQTANVITITTSYDNKYNRPESVQTVQQFPCRVSRKNHAYPFTAPSNVTIDGSFRGYFEIDAEIKKGSVVEVEGTNYIVGMIYKPMNHHIECDLRVQEEA